MSRPYIMVEYWQEPDLPLQWWEMDQTIIPTDWQEREWAKNGNGVIKPGNRGYKCSWYNADFNLID